MDDLGGPMRFNHYPVGWAHAMDTPFQWTKQVASHFGGTRNGLVISWPARIKDKGIIRTQFSSVIDIYPTILEAVGVESPSMLNGVPQQPIEGFSLVYTFDNPKAKSDHRTQYFEMFTNRAIYNDGWVAATTPPSLPWVMGGTMPPVEDYKWELYNVDQDFSEANDLAAKEPKRLRQLQDLFWAEAGNYNCCLSTTARRSVLMSAFVPASLAAALSLPITPAWSGSLRAARPISKTSRTASRRMSRFLMAA
jgi:arylsulfatase A-like enzyme